MFRRLDVVKAKIRLSEDKQEDPSTSSRYRYRKSIPLSTELERDAVARALKQEGYRVFGQPERFYAVKNRFSPVATILFHLSFLLILAGGIVGLYTRFSAYLDLAAGEEIDGSLDRFTKPLTIPKIGAIPSGSFKVTDIRPEMIGDTPAGLQVDILDPAGKITTADINKPYKPGKVSFVVKDLGVAPLVILQDRSGKEVDGAYVKLNVLRGKQDHFKLQGVTFTVDFFPDYAVQDGIEISRSEEVRNPAFRFALQGRDSVPLQSTIRPGEEAALGAYRLKVPSVLYWVRFYVVKEEGLELVYAGFFLSVFALIWRFGYYQRELVGRRINQEGKEVLLLAGRAEFYPALYEDEFNELTERIMKFSNRVNSDMKRPSADSREPL